MQSTPLPHRLTHIEQLLILTSRSRQLSERFLQVVFGQAREQISVDAHFDASRSFAQQLLRASQKMNFHSGASQISEQSRDILTQSPSLRYG